MNNKEKRKISIILNIVAIFIVVALTVLLVKSESKSSGISEFEMQASSYESGNRVGMQDIGISLLENGKIVAYRNYDSDSGGDTWSERGGVLLEDLLQGDNIKLGKDYDEIITVENTGTINEYVRATIYKYWIQNWIHH